MPCDGCRATRPPVRCDIADASGTSCSVSGQPVQELTGATLPPTVSASDRDWTAIEIVDQRLKMVAGGLRVPLPGVQAGQQIHRFRVTPATDMALHVLDGDRCLTHVDHCPPQCERDISKFVLRVLFENPAGQLPDIRVALLTRRHQSRSPERRQVVRFLRQRSLVRGRSLIQESDVTQRIAPLNELMRIADLDRGGLQSGEFLTTSPAAHDGGAAKIR